MNGGAFAFFASIAIVLLAWIGGKASSKRIENAKREAREAKAEAQNAKVHDEIVSDVSSAIVKSVETKAEAEIEHNKTMAEIETAKEANDIDRLMEIAKRMAERAISKGASER